MLIVKETGGSDDTQNVWERAVLFTSPFIRLPSSLRVVKTEVDHHPLFVSVDDPTKVGAAVPNKNVYPYRSAAHNTVVSGG